MSEGHLEVTDEKWHLFGNPQTLAAAKLIGCKNISRAKKYPTIRFKHLAGAPRYKQAQSFPIICIMWAFVHTTGSPLTARRKATSFKVMQKLFWKILFPILFSADHCQTRAA